MTSHGQAVNGEGGGNGDGRIVVIGLGNEFRRDDGAGPAVVELLRARPLRDVDLLVSEGEPGGLLTDWTGASLAVVVDAIVASPAVPGRLHRVEAGLDRADDPAAGLAWGPAASSHGLGLGEAVSLGAALGRAARAADPARRGSRRPGPGGRPQPAGGGVPGHAGRGRAAGHPGQPWGAARERARRLVAWRA